MRNTTKYYQIKYTSGHPREGQVEAVTEPIARTLVGNGSAVALDKLPPETRASEAGTKRISSDKVAAKAG